MVEGESIHLANGVGPKMGKDGAGIGFDFGVEKVGQPVSRIWAKSAKPGEVFRDCVRVLVEV